jgi:hypothetical protein
MSRRRGQGRLIGSARLGSSSLGSWRSARAVAIRRSWSSSSAPSVARRPSSWRRRVGCDRSAGTAERERLHRTGPGARGLREGRRHRVCGIAARRSPRPPFTSAWVSSPYERSNLASPRRASSMPWARASSARLLLPSRRRHLRRPQLGAVEQHRIGESAAHVHAQNRHDGMRQDARRSTRGAGGLDNEEFARDPRRQGSGRIQCALR